jgi:integrase
MRFARCSRSSGGSRCGTSPSRTSAPRWRRWQSPIPRRHCRRRTTASPGPLRHAEGRDLVRRNVSALVDTPHGRQGRPSQALTVEQAAALLEAAEDSRLHAYIVLCLLTGVRSEEARALTWDHVDLDARTISVWRSVRAHGDTKTVRSRRTLRIPQIAIEALQEQLRRQAGERARAGGAVAGARPGVHHHRGHAV